MARVEYTLKARNDILAIYEYIAASGEQYADAFLDRLEARCKLLEAAPHSGRRRPDFRPEIRTFPLRPSVVFYTVEDDVVKILRVVDGRRDLGTIFAEDV